MTLTPALTQAEVARQLGVDRSTVRRWTRSGRLPVWFVDENGRAVYSAETIAAAQRRAGELHSEQAKGAA